MRHAVPAPQAPRPRRLASPHCPVALSPRPVPKPRADASAGAQEPAPPPPRVAPCPVATRPPALQPASLCVSQLAPYNPSPHTPRSPTLRRPVGFYPAPRSFPPAPPRPVFSRSIPRHRASASAPQPATRSLRLATSDLASPAVLHVARRAPRRPSIPGTAVSAF